MALQIIIAPPPLTASSGWLKRSIDMNIWRWSFTWLTIIIICVCFTSTQHQCASPPAPVSSSRFGDLMTRASTEDRGCGSQPTAKRRGWSGTRRVPLSVTSRRPDPSTPYRLAVVVQRGTMHCNVLVGCLRGKRVPGKLYDTFIRQSAHRHASSTPRKRQ